ncbi:MAG: pyruvate:ferredoxin (flavodoxin) oxidoreductase, partial [Chitinophagaceae bacterium]
SDADRVIVAMGSVTETIKEVIDYLTEKGEKVGLVSVHLYRPFSAKHLRAAVPISIKRIAVLDRTKEPGSPGEPLYLDIKDSYYGQKNAPLIVGGRYGLSSKDTTPAQILSVYENLSMNEPKNDFTIGIVDDITFKSLPKKQEISINKELYEAKFYGLGSDGTVGANKNSIKIIGENTDKYCQAYFDYDSKKAGGYTCSHLRFGDEPIRSTYLVNTPDFVACHVSVYVQSYDVTRGLKPNGIFLLNSIYSVEDTKNFLPDSVKAYLAKNNISFYIINASKIAKEIGLGKRTNTILQSAFFKITEVIPYELAVEQMKKFIIKSYGKKGEKVINMNYQAVDRGAEYVKVEIPKEWTNLGTSFNVNKKDDAPEFVQKVVRPINAQLGNDLPVSTFKDREDGTWEQGMAFYDKRGVGGRVPVWIPENCIQCNICAYVCPHAAIRPFVLNSEEQAKAPQFDTLKTIGKQLENTSYRIQVDVLDCLGCDNCANACPGNKGGTALEMVDIETQYEEQKNWDFLVKEICSKAHLLDITSNVKNTQFATPLFEFSGACAGCGETPYIKLLTQLFGDHQIIANATGCTSIYSGSLPSTPYTMNEQGYGPAWANSLFEDNAEFGLGMLLATNKLRHRLQELMTEALSNNECSLDLKALCQEWLEKKDDVSSTQVLSKKISALLENTTCEIGKKIRELKAYIIKTSQWVLGGDGWAYDIGYGGVDHVLSTGENINLFVVDTEVYSNTGGQSSKSTPMAAIAKFAATGKKIRKKDLGLMATTYGYVYVAQIAMGANQAQTLRAIKEAEAYNGPSLIIAYSPCIAHGMEKGMSETQEREAEAVQCGYWHLWRYNPDLEKQGKNPFILDSKEPKWDKFEDFLKGEVRYNALLKEYPTEGQELFNAAMDVSKWRYHSYARFVKGWDENFKE